jgi:hypothetical protein
MATWEERAAFRASLRREAAEAVRRRREDEDRAALIAADPPLAGEDGEPETDGPHRGHYTHSLPWHLGLVMCSCGEFVGCYSFISSGEPEPEPCPVCVARGIAAGRALEDFRPNV